MGEQNVIINQDMARIKSSKLPLFFKPLFWSYDFSLVDAKTNEKTIIINTINHGDWRHWRWVIRFYGKQTVKKIIQETPATEFRKTALKLISILLGIKNIKYASRSDYIRSQKVFKRSSLEIASMKAYTLGRRATLKDYIDLYFVVKEKIGSLEEIINLSQKKHGERFDPRLFLEQLIYLEDVEPIAIQLLRETVDQQEIQGFFEKEVGKIKI